MCALYILDSNNRLIVIGIHASLFLLTLLNILTIEYHQYTRVWSKYVSIFDMKNGTYKNSRIDKFILYVYYDLIFEKIERSMELSEISQK